MVTIPRGIHTSVFSEIFTTFYVKNDLHPLEYGWVHFQERLVHQTIHINAEKFWSSRLIAFQLTPPGNWQIKMSKSYCLRQSWIWLRSCHVFIWNIIWLFAWKIYIVSVRCILQKVDIRARTVACCVPLGQAIEMLINTRKSTGT